MANALWHIALPKDPQEVPCVAVPLASAADRVISPMQKGGLKGRKFIEHILDLEAKLLQYMVTNMLHAGVIALDQEAAFPSISSIRTKTL